ncbi:MAG: prepilin-type N-terminal cleavage/methylation domain-containing protein [Kiritimatiellaeota bacterium]|nr:prepilin-type N-terminal cleavage/methylation domain-containing protein [Kiritimatiellota bacterium]
MNMYQRIIFRGFTLIELLVVIVIVMLMASLLFPAIISIIKKGEIALARSEVMAIDAAMHNYLLKYGHFPNQTLAGTQATPYHCYGSKETNVVLQPGEAREYRALFNTLIGTPGTRFEDNPTVNPNPHNVVFLQVPNRSGGGTNRTLGINNSALQGDFCDPWGCRYQVMASWNMDNRVNGTAYGNVIGRNVAVWNSTRTKLTSW